MRVLMLAAALSVTVCTAASAQNTAPNAQALYVERRALLDTDTRCHLFAPNVHNALQAGAGQAAGALLRGGWTRVRLNELEQAAIGAARSRACNDPRTASAAQAAQAGFLSWSRTHSMSFTGGERAWVARRTPDPQGWRLRQQIPTPLVATFGVREREDVQRLSFVMPLAAGAAPPASAQLLMRDPARAGTNILDLRGRLTTGLAAGLPTPNATQRFFANSRRAEHEEHQPNQIVFTFPDAAYQRLLQLDPRETVSIEIETRGQIQRFLVEVGDVAAAGAFLAISAES